VRYALVGIYKLNPGRFKQLTDPLVESSEKVSIMEGCIISHEPFNRLVKQIAAGKDEDPK
jgi:major membrane immunogen (membrane-anchored lipoprotein)